MAEPVRLAVAGAGAIGRKHVEAIEASGVATVAAIADPAGAARDYAAARGIDWLPELVPMIEAAEPDGVVLATPNQLHVSQALDCIACGLPVLVEKPIAADVAGARRLVDAAEAAGVPVLVGHHRRHNPLIHAAKAALEEDRIGRLVTVHASVLLYKPDDYFLPEWRRLPGAGPVLTNLVHDIDLLRHLCGEIESVQALESAAIRGHPNEDSAAALLRFASGALGTVAVSDTAVAPWSWELTAAENPAYPATGQSCYFLAGTHGALELPNLRLWRNPGPRGWHEPMESVALPVEPEEPLLRQIRHFAEVIRGTADPLVPAREGLKALEAVEAISCAARIAAGIRPGASVDEAKRHGMEEQRG